MSANKRIALMAATLAIGSGTLAACTAAAPQAPVNAARANPSAEKCLADGYRLEARLENGVPSDYDCVDSRAGRRCDAWAYFRGECRLTPADENRANPPRKSRN